MNQQDAIAIVDDDPRNRMVLEDMLIGTPYRTFSAESGYQALELAEHEPIQLMLLDLMMPGMNGHEVMHVLREKYNGHGPSVLVVTAVNDIRALETSFELGADDYLIKPVERRELLARITAKLKLRRMQQELSALNAQLEQRAGQLAGQLVQSEKMSAIGMLTSGLAHDLNNIFTGSIGCLKLACKTDELAEIRECHEMSLDCLQLGMALVRNLLNFVRQEPQKLEVFSLRASFELAERVLAHRLKRQGIRVIQEWPDEEMLVRGDEKTLSQVFLNLIQNAQDAVAGLRNRGRILLTARQAGDWHEVCIDDNGPGIDPDIRGKIFEPLYTTKPSGKGTGLGLHVSAQIIAGHNGQLQAGTNDWNGARFRVRLPVAGVAHDHE